MATESDEEKVEKEMSPRRWLPGLLLLVLIGCGTGQETPRENAGVDDPSRANHSGASMSMDSTARDQPVRRSTTASGIAVTLHVEDGPLQVGTRHIGVGFDQPPTAADALTVDVASADMPMMGVRRFALTPDEDTEGRFRAMVDFPMAGSWKVYVNLDDGTDAASFELNVQPGPGGMSHGPVGGDDPPESTHGH